MVSTSQQGEYRSQAPALCELSIVLRLHKRINMCGTIEGNRILIKFRFGNSDRESQSRR